MALESRETSNGLAPELERRHAVRDALIRVRDERDDRVAQLGKRCPLGLIERAKVLVDLLLGHTGILTVGAEGVKGAQPCPRVLTVPAEAGGDAIIGAMGVHLLEAEP